MRDLGMRLSVAALLAGSLVAPASPAAAAPPVCTDTAADEGRAVAMATACRRAVVVAGSRTELTQVIAQPDGRMTFESAVVPQRARTRDGGWAGVDLRLSRGEDGRLSSMLTRHCSGCSMPNSSRSGGERKWV